VPNQDSTAFDPIFTIKNTSMDTKTVVIILAAYDGRGRLIGVELYSNEIGAGSTMSDIRTSLPLFANAANYRFFVWQDGHLPLTRITSVSQLQ
jgi:hypothetical protein